MRAAIASATAALLTIMVQPGRRARVLVHLVGGALPVVVVRSESV